MITESQKGLDDLFAEIDGYEKIVQEKNLLPNKEDPQLQREYMQARKDHTYVQFFQIKQFDMDQEV